MKKWFGFLCVMLCLAVYAQAQLSVVRVDGTTVYLDTSDEKTAPVKGSTFKVIVSTEKLTNPQTGKNLGDLYHYSAVGTITDVQPLYAVGKLPDAKGVRVGQPAVWEDVTPTVQALPAAAQTAVPAAAPALPYTLSEPIEQSIISLTQAGVTAPDAANLITLSDQNEITVFSRGAKGTWQPQLTFALPAGKKGLAVSAAAVKPGTAQLFVSVLDDQARITTLVLENQDGTLQKTATLPLYVKELGCGADKKIWAQRPFVLGTNPGNAREIVFEKNKFVASGATLNTRHNWLAGLNDYPVQTAQKDNLITTAANGTLRLWLNNGKTAESKDLFGSSPLRAQYKQQILKFYPAVQVFGEPGRATLAAVENGTKLGLLSETFGQYRAGKIHFLQYEKGSLKVTQTAELDGVIYDTTCTDNAVLVAEVLPDGTSRVVEILK